MPYKKNYRKKAPKRKYNNKRRAKYQKARPSAMTTAMKGNGFADMVFAKLSYAEAIGMNPGTTVFQYAFKGNSIYDPNQTGGGHQPLYHDQYIQVYSKYRVLASSIRVDVINSSGTSALFMVVNPNTTTSGFSTFTELYEQMRSGAPTIVPIAQRISKVIKKYASTRQVCGLAKSQVYDDTFAAASGADPNNVWYWNIFAESTDGTSDVVGTLVVKISYYVQFFDRLLTAQS